MFEALQLYLALSRARVGTLLEVQEVALDAYVRQQKECT
jgi:hypothetical protein